MYGKRLAGLLLASTVAVLCACGGGGGGIAPAPAQPVTQPVAISVSPSTATLEAGTPQRFSASVSNAGNTSVSWSVKESGGGIISPDGTYTPPVATGTFHIVATSQADISKSATATVTVTAPPLLFESQAPTGASEGVAYSYTALARDRVASDVSYDWKELPAGAAASAATVTWTPTPAQSRTANTFRVEARTALGTTAQQSWTVTPRGTIRVFANDVHYTASGTVNSVFTIAENYQVSAWIGSGIGASQLPGIAQSDGSVHIPNVPAGRFWLSLGNGEWFETDKSSIDLGMNFTGRGDGATDVAAGPQKFSFKLSGLSAWNAGSELRYWGPNTGENLTLASRLMQAGSALLEGDEDASVALLDGSSSDTGYLLQLSPFSSGGLEGQIATRYFGPLTATMSDGGTTALEGAMSPFAQAKTFTLSMPATAIAQSANAVHAGRAASQPPHFSIEVQPFAANGSDGARPVLFHGVGTAGTDLAATIEWGSPFPPEWQTVFSYIQALEVNFTAPGGVTVSVPAEIVALTAVPSAAAPFVVPVQPVKDVTIDAQAFFSPAANISATPTLRWTPVTAPGTSVNGYTVVVTEVAGGGALREVAWVNTPQQSVTIPSGILHAGGTYVFTIRAWSDAAMKIDEAPYRWGYPSAWAFAVSGIVQVTGTPSATAAASESVAPRVTRRVR